MLFSSACYRLTFNKKRTHICREKGLEKVNVIFPFFFSFWCITMSTGSLNPTSMDHFQIHAYIMTQKNEGKKYLHPKNGWQRMNKMSALGMSTASPSLIHMHTYSCWADHCRSGLLRRVKAKSETRENSVSRNSSADAHLLHSLQQHRKQNKTKQNNFLVPVSDLPAMTSLSFNPSPFFLQISMYGWHSTVREASINQ